MRRICCLFILAHLAAPSWGQTLPTPAPTASSILAPVISQLRNSLDNVRLEKWKAPGPVREDASSNIGSIRRDLDATLPALMTTADAAPGSVAKVFPVYRNVDALYDVLLRVAETADLAAPNKEADGLQNALSALEDARRSLGDAIENAAAGQEQQNLALVQRVRVLQAVRPVVAPVVTDTSKPVAKEHHRKRETRKKEHPQPSSPQ